MKTWVFNETMLDEALKAWTESGAPESLQPSHPCCLVTAFLVSSDAKKLRVAQLDSPPPLPPASEAAMIKAA